MFKNKTESISADDYQKTPVTASSQFHQGLQKAKKTLVNDKVFASGAEATCYQELLLLGMAGHLSGLRTQVKFELRINGVKIGSYKADFTYNDEQGRIIVEAKRGHISPTEKFKLRVIKACLEGEHCEEFKVWSDGKYLDFK